MPCINYRNLVIDVILNDKIHQKSGNAVYVLNKGRSGLSQFVFYGI